MPVNNLDNVFQKFSRLLFALRCPFLHPIKGKSTRSRLPKSAGSSTSFRRLGGERKQSLFALLYNYLDKSLVEKSTYLNPPQPSLKKGGSRLRNEIFNQRRLPLFVKRGLGGVFNDMLNSYNLFIYLLYQ